MMSGKLEIFCGPGFVRAIDDNFMIDRLIPGFGDGAVKSTWATPNDAVLANRRAIYLDREIACGRSSDPHNERERRLELMYGWKTHGAGSQVSSGSDDRRFYQFDSDGAERDEHTGHEHETGDCRENCRADDTSANRAFGLVM